MFSLRCSFLSMRSARVWLLTAAAVAASGVPASAQDLFGRGSPLRNTPFDPSTIGRTARDLDQERLKMMSNSPRPGRDYTKLYVKNNTGKTISVALRVDEFAWSATPTSELKSVDPSGSNPFRTLAWFRLNPGQRVHVANTNNINVYFYGEGPGISWAGEHRRPVPDGNRSRTVGFRHALINAGRVEEHTIKLQ